MTLSKTTMTFFSPGHDLQEVVLQRPVSAIAVGSGDQERLARRGCHQLGLSRPHQGPDEEKGQDPKEPRVQVCRHFGPGDLKQLHFMYSRQN